MDLDARRLERGARLANQIAVPTTGVAWRKPWRWLRKPRHAGLKRALAAWGARGVDRVPDDYDDIPRHVERSWKAHRLTRWRA